MLLFIRYIKSFITSRSPATKFAHSFLYLIFLSIIFTGVYIYFENENIFEGIYQSIETFTTVGYGDNPPESTGGKLAAAALMILGIQALANLFGTWTDYRQDLTTKKRYGLMKNKYKDGYIIFNAPDREQLLRIIEEVRAIEKNAPFCIVDNSIQELPPRIAVLPKICFIKDSALRRETYESANVNANKVIFIFPIEPENSESDGTTAQTAKLLSKFIDNSRTRIIAALVDPKNGWLFSDLEEKCTLVSTTIELEMMVQEAQDIYSAKIIEKLYKNREGANPTTVQISKVLAGTSWSDFEIACAVYSKNTGMSINTFALIKNGIPETCPDDPGTILEENDYVSVLVKGRFDWQKAEKEIAAFSTRLKITWT